MRFVMACLRGSCRRRSGAARQSAACADRRAALIRLDEAKLRGLEAFATTLPSGQRKRLTAALRPIVDDINQAGTP